MGRQMCKTTSDDALSHVFGALLDTIVDMSGGTDKPMSEQKSVSTPKMPTDQPSEQAAAANTQSNLSLIHI